MRSIRSARRSRSTSCSCTMRRPASSWHASRARSGERRGGARRARRGRPAASLFLRAPPHASRWRGRRHSLHRSQPGAHAGQPRGDRLRSAHAEMVDPWRVAGASRRPRCVVGRQMTTKKKQPSATTRASKRSVPAVHSARAPRWVARMRAAVQLVLAATEAHGKARHAILVEAAKDRRRAPRATH